MPCSPPCPGLLSPPYPCRLGARGEPGSRARWRVPRGLEAERVVVLSRQLGAQSVSGLLNAVVSRVSDI